MWLWAALGVGLALRLAWLETLDAVPFYDAQSYFNLAVDLVDGQPYEEYGSAYWPVGYPATLAAFFAFLGKTVAAGEVLNVLASLLTIGLTYSLGHILYSRSVARTAAFIVALLPSQIFANTLILSEVLFTAVQLGAIVLIVAALSRAELEDDLRRIFAPKAAALVGLAFLVPAVNGPSIVALFSIAVIAIIFLLALTRGSQLTFLWSAAAVLTGYALLIRPAALPLVAAAILAALLMSRRSGLSAASEGGGRINRLLGRKTLGYAGLYLGVSFLVVAPWMMRNFTEIGTPTLSTTGGVNFLIGNHDGANGCWSFNYEEHGYIWEIQDEVEREREAFRQGFNFVRSDPLQAVSLIPLRFDCMWREDGDALGHWNRFEQPEALDSHTHNLLMFVNQWYYWLLLGVAVIGVPAWLRTNPAHLVPLLVVALTTGYYLLFVGDDRYHQPLLPLIAVWGACGIGFLPRWWRQRPITWPRDGG